MAKRKPDPGADYRAAKAAVGEHVQRWADAERSLHAWLKAKRGVPRHLLYDPKTGDATDPELAELEEAVVEAEAAVTWCRALVVACGEVVKGVPFDEVPTGPRPSQAELLAKVED